MSENQKAPGEGQNADRPFGRRKTDHLVDPVIKADGRYYIKGSHYYQLRRHTESLTLLLESTRSLMELHDRTHLLPVIMDKVTYVMNAERSSLFLVDSHRKELWSRVAQGTEEIRIPMGKGIAGRVAQTGMVMNIPNAYEHPDFRSEYDLMTGFKTGSILCIPIRGHSGDVIGSLEILNRKDGHPFDAQDEDMLHAFASLAAIALENASAYESMENERTQLYTLVDSTRALMSALDIDSLLNLILLRVTGVMQADRSTLFLLDSESKELVSRIAQGSDAIRLPPGKGIAGFVVENGISLNIPDAYRDPRFNHEYDKSTGYLTRSILCSPVKGSSDTILGAIEVLNRKDGTPFNERDVDLLQAFASLAGIALENARIHEELLQERNNLELRVQERTRELEAAVERSDELLQNILPLEIASELKETGHTRSRRHENVSVMFADFEDFSRIADGMSESELVSLLDLNFGIFDDIVDHFKLEKIKTIGDAYMCAGGLAARDSTSALRMVLAAMEMIRSLKNVHKTKGSPLWRIRIGIHTGSVTAGVVGKRKFAYDIWGTTVNIASRLESAGETERIHISREMANLVDKYFQVTSRGMIEARNIGEIESFYVNRIAPIYSADTAGESPSELLLQIAGIEKSFELNMH